MSLPAEFRDLIKIQETLKRHDAAFNLVQQQAEIASATSMIAATERAQTLQMEFALAQGAMEAFRVQGAANLELARGDALREQNAAYENFRTDIRHYLNLTKMLPGNGFSQGIERFVRSIDSARPAAEMIDKLGARSGALEAYRNAAEVATFQHAEFRNVAAAIPDMQQQLAGVLGFHAHNDLYEAYLLSRRVLGDTDDPVPAEQVEKESLVRSIIGALLVAAIAFKQNSIDAGRRFSALELLSILLALLPIMANSGYSEEDRQRDVETSREFAKWLKTAERVADAERQRADVIAKLPRAEVLFHGARLRTAPTRTAEIRATLRAGENVAILEKSGRWFRVVYSDPITSEPKDAWAWAKSIRLLTPNTASP